MDGITGTSGDVAARLALEEALRDKSTEPDLQRLLNNHLRVLAYGLPVRVREASIEIRGRPGLSEADYVFVDRQGSELRYGVIELKSPQQPVLCQPRKGVYALSASATTAVQQTHVYGSQLRAQLGADGRVGTPPELYVVMGRSFGRDAQLVEKMDRDARQRVFPPDVRFVTYDALLAQFVERCGAAAHAEPGQGSAPGRWLIRLPTPRDRAWKEHPIVDGVAELVVDRLRASEFSDVSLYTRTHSWSSASEFDTKATRSREPEFVYLLYGHERIWMMEVGAGLVLRIESHQVSDERIVLREFGAGPKVMHWSVGLTGADILAANLHQPPSPPGTQP